MSRAVEELQASNSAKIAEVLDLVSNLCKSHDELLAAAKGVIEHPGLYGPYRDALKAAIENAEKLP